MKRIIAFTLIFSLVIGASLALGQEVVLELKFNGQLQLISVETLYGIGEVMCPSGSVALGGGSLCSSGDLDVSYPIRNYRNGYYVPVGWREHHRGASTYDCEVYAICVPEDWFDAGEIRVVRNRTGYGIGRVNCPRDFKAISGGSRCTDGDFDVAYPNSTLTGWNEWHRGASSYDCEAYAVCVSEDHWIGATAYLVSAPTGYGQGDVGCGRDGIAIGGGSYCTSGDFDVSYPLGDLSGWAEHHRGASTYDCRVYGVCLPHAGFERNLPGESCGPTDIFDCDLKCVNADRAHRWMSDSVCDDGRWGMDLVCEAFDFDNCACGCD